MGLIASLRRAAVSRPAVLVATCPGATEARLGLERALRARGWPVAVSPATANLLAVVGEPDPTDRGWCEGLWRAMPAPRARVHIGRAEEVEARLDEGAAALARALRESPADRGGTAGDGARAERGGRGGRDDRPTQPGHQGAGSPDGHSDHDAHEEHDGHSDHGAHGEHDGHQSDNSHNGHDDHQDHGGHGGHGAGMKVAGLPMADRGDDRDGLRLDQLHCPLGPALGDWPAGLVLHLTLQGDVVRQARAARVPALPRSGLPFWNEPWLRAAAGERVAAGEAARRCCAAHLDSVGRLLAVAGWPAEAARARRACDGALLGRPAAAVVALVRPLVRRVGCSRTLRWLTAGLGVLGADAAAKAGVTGPALAAGRDVHGRAGGDVWDRLGLWLTEAARHAAACDDAGPLEGAHANGPRGTVRGTTPPSRALLEVLPTLVEGADVAAARLVVASLDPDLDELVATPGTGMARG